MDSQDATFLKRDEVESYRKHFEIDDHWKMKKDFILTYIDDIPKDQLLCYAQLYINIEVLKNE